MAYSELGRRYPHHPHHRAAHPSRRRAPASFGLKISALIAILILAAWSGATTLYLYFHDDALKYLVTHQTKMVRSYDAQMAVLESEVARLKSLKLIDQERIDHVVSDLAQRQAEVEGRQKRLAEIVPNDESRGRAAAENKRSIPRQPARDSDFGIMPKPSPISDKIYLRPGLDRSTELRARVFVDADASQPIETRIVNLSRGLDRIEARQNRALQQIEKSYHSQEARMREVLADVDIAAPAPSRPRAVGGPFVPLKAGEYAFDRRLARAEETAAAVSDLGRVLDFVPVRYPVPRGTDITSGFGVRTDPFLHQPALHSGIDFRGNPGDPARATAAGVVTHAGYRGGYGLMVEIDHGHGYVTRYGHLSAIKVTKGHHVRAGDVVGRIGTTGRSTGPHLHYEVRVKGKAIDPMRYLRAGRPLQQAG